MSTSAGFETIAGSKSATSWAMGKLSVWSGASGSGDGPGFGVGLQEMDASTNPRTNAGLRIGEGYSGVGVLTEREPHATGPFTFTLRRRLIGPGAGGREAGFRMGGGYGSDSAPCRRWRS